MPAFDVVSKLDLHELTNALDQANRELTNRFDFKGTGAEFARDEETVTDFFPLLDPAPGRIVQRRLL